MIGRALHLTSALCLGCTVLAIIFWIHSYEYLDYLNLDRNRLIWSQDGLIVYWSFAGSEVFALALPHKWIVAGLIAISAMTILFGRHRPGVNRAGSFCRHCGYDLRASRDRCPECGTFIETGTKAAT